MQTGLMGEYFFADNSLPFWHRSTTGLSNELRQLNKAPATIEKRHTPQPNTTDDLKLILSPPRQNSDPHRQEAFER